MLSGIHDPKDVPRVDAIYYDGTNCRQVVEFINSYTATSEFNPEFSSIFTKNRFGRNVVIPVGMVVYQVLSSPGWDPQIVSKESFLEVWKKA